MRLAPFFVDVICTKLTDSSAYTAAAGIMQIAAKSRKEPGFPSKEVKRRKGRADNVAEHFSAGRQPLDIVLPAEAEVHVSEEQNDRQNHSDDIFSAHAGADRCDDPAEQRGAGEYEQEEAGQKKQDDPSRADAVFHAVDDTAGQGDEKLVQIIDAEQREQAGSQNRAGRYGHGKQQFIILRFKQLSLGQKYTSDESQEKYHQSHKSEIQPAHTGLYEGIPQCQENLSEQQQKDGENEDGEVWFYGYAENPDDPNEEPVLEYIEDDLRKSCRCF